MPGNEREDEMDGFDLFNERKFSIYIDKLSTENMGAPQAICKVRISRIANPGCRLGISEFLDNFSLF